MKLKTKLLITGITMMVLPFVLMVAAFLCITYHLVRSDQRSDLEGKFDYVGMSGTVQEISMRTDAIFQEAAAQESTGRLEEKDWLEELNRQAKEEASYIIVRKGEALYYAGNDTDCQRLFPQLPAYGFPSPGGKKGYYLHDMRVLVKQLDFLAADGTESSLFIVSPVHMLIARPLLVDLVVATICILIFTSLMLTRWIRRAVIAPVTELNIAMQKIAEGNLDYRIQESASGEIRQLYDNYEDMRLRLKESTEEKIQSERHSRELISNISHDLKTPITAIQGYVEGIMDGVADTPEKMDKYIRTIYNKANDMDLLINELTLYSNIDSNRIPYHFHRLNVSKYFRDCVEEVGLDLESKNIQLNYANLVSPDTQIIADPEQLKRVINNIIGNSVKYLDDRPGEIDIRILDEVDAIRVEIEDNGIGIAAKDLGNIFERFYRTDSSRNSSRGGSGIGLSIVKKIIEDHGGYIWATSKEGEGTCLHFVIRKYQEAEETGV